MKIDRLLRRFLPCALGAAMLAAAPSARAAILTLESITPFTANFPTPVDLTTEGTLDWAYWRYISATTAPAPFAPTNSKLDGSLIGNASALGGGGLRGSTTATTAGRYSFSDGTSPTNDTNLGMGGLVFNTNLGANTVGKGFTLNISGDPGIEQIVRLYFGGFGVNANLTLTLSGATTVVDTSQTFAANGTPKPISVYTVRFKPDNIGDTLKVDFTAVSQSSGSAHVGLEAITVSAVPEPGSMLLMLGGSAGLLLRRRRERA